MDYFSLLGVPRRLDLDQAYLRDRYYQRCAELHPDRRPVADGVTRGTATLQSAEINQAYRVLRDPVTRARYWLDLRGGSRRGQTTVIPKAIADTCLATHEFLHRIDAGEAAATALLGVEQSRLATLRNQLVLSLETQFVLWNDRSADSSQLAEQLRESLLELGYLDKLLKELSQRLEALGGA